MKVFISMPMRGRSDEDIVKFRDQVFGYIKGKLPEAELIDSILNIQDKGLVDDDLGLQFFGASISLLAEADMVFFTHGWEETRGCALERKVAEAYGKFCVDVKKY